MPANADSACSSNSDNSIGGKKLVQEKVKIVKQTEFTQTQLMRMTGKLKTLIQEYRQSGVKWTGPEQVSLFTEEEAKQKIISEEQHTKFFEQHLKSKAEQSYLEKVHSHNNAQKQA